MPRKLVIGNWKMNGTVATNAALSTSIAEGVSSLRGVEVAVCPPLPYLSHVQVTLHASAVKWGAQDVSAAVDGPYTGQTSASMLREFGCSYVLVGHSERRHGLNEDNVLVAAKAMRALEAGMAPVVCVGETLAERDAGQAEAVVLAQLEAVISKLGSALNGIVVAYEPVWAIGTGITASAEDAQEIHAMLRRRLVLSDAAVVPLLYGGSVKPENASSLFRMPDIDGGLIGGAALNAAAFIAICAARQVQ